MAARCSLLPLVIVLFGAPVFAQSKPLDVSFGWTYEQADQGAGFASISGWYGTLSWEATQRVGLSFQHESYWGSFRRGGINDHVWLGGITAKLRKGNPKVSPFIQPMAGSTRNSASGSIQSQPTIQLGAGADITLKGNLSLEIEPAEYVFNWASGSALNSYAAAAGLQYSIGK